MSLQSDVDLKGLRYVIGGTLAPDAPSYVERQADGELLSGLVGGETCYVLNSRQMGKSSLCVRTILRLKGHGIRAAFCDLTKLGGRNLTAEQWYAALLSEIGRELGLRTEFLNHWKENGALPAVQRLFGAISEIGPAQGPLVIFIDEIDVTLSLPFSADEFFAAIRQCYVGRATDETLKNLSFCLLGTAAPADLIQDTRVSPFNIGKRIELRDFTEEEAKPLAAGLGSADLLSRVLYWTGGHPYLTQRLCHAVQMSEAKTKAEVDRVCSDLFLVHKAKDSDDNLSFVRNRLLKSEADLAALLDLYRVMRSGKLVRDDETNALCVILKLSGVAKVEDGLLKVRNRIYEHVFDAKWTQSHMPDAEKRRQKEAFRRGVIRTASWAAAALVVFAFLATSALLNARDARIQAALASLRERQSQTNASRAQEEASRADRQATEAGRERAKAIVLAHQADAERAKAIEFAAQVGAERGKAVQLASGRAKALTAEQLATARAERETAISDAQRGRSEQLLYVADMRLEQEEWDSNNLGGVTKLLAETSRSPHRGFEWYYWQRMAHPKSLITTLKEHDGVVYCVSFSPDGKRLATASGGTAKIWDAQTGRKILTLRGHTEFLEEVSFSPDGRHVATTSVDGTARIWDARTGGQILTLQTGGPSPLAYAPDGKRLATGFGDANTALVRIWDAQTGRAVLTIAGLHHGPTDIAFSPDGKRLAIGDERVAAIWDAQSGRRILVLSGHTDDVWGVGFSPDGKRLVTASFDNTARVWDAYTGRQLLTLTGHTRHLNRATFSPNGKLIATASYDGTAKIWDAQTGTEVFTISGHSGDVTGVAFSPDGKRLATGAADGIAKIWDASPQAETLTLGGPGSAVRWAALSPDGKRVATGSTDGTARIWDAQTGRDVHTLEGDRLDVYSVEFSPDGKLVATTDGLTAAIWDAQSGRELLQLRGHSGFVTTAEFSPDGTRVVTASNDRTANIWDARTGRLIVTLTGHGGPIYAAVFSPDGRLVATASEDKSVKIWGAQTGREIRTLTGHKNSVHSLAFSHDSTRLASGSWDATAKIWNVRTGRELLTLTGPRFLVRCVAFSPDDKRLATASFDGTAQIWDAQTGDEMLILKGHTQSLMSVGFSADGSRLTTVSYDQTARFWDAASPAQVASWEREDSEFAGTAAGNR